MGRYVYYNMDRVGERNILFLGILRIIMLLRIGYNVKVILVYVVFFVVLESEELIVSLVLWFDEQSEDKGYKFRKVSSIGSFNDFLFYDKNDTVDGKSRLEIKDFKLVIFNNLIDGFILEFNLR